VIEYPQSGERIRGWSNIRAVAENYPGGLPKDVVGKVVGSEDKSRRRPTFMESRSTRRPGGRSGWSERAKFDDLVESRAQPRPRRQGNRENCPVAVAFVT
jgi:hypothetical protein